MSKSKTIALNICKAIGEGVEFPLGTILDKLSQNPDKNRKWLPEAPFKINMTLIFFGTILE